MVASVETKPFTGGLLSWWAGGAMGGHDWVRPDEALASVPIPKFASTGGTLSCELRNQRDTSKYMILVPLLNPKFAIGLPARLCELRVRGTSGIRSIACPRCVRQDRDASGHLKTKANYTAMAGLAKTIRTGASRT